MATGAPHQSHKLKLVIYPGEKKDGNGTTVGHIYIVGGKHESYEMAGGPPPGHGSSGPGGHTAGVTPAGHYVLGQQEHHTTQNWPMSVIPWGAPLREHGGEIQYQLGKQWIDASGPRGKMTQAYVLWFQRSGQHLTTAQAGAEVRKLKQFRQASGALKPTWDLNDFGKWSWNLLKNGARSAYYIHTVPDDEFATAANVPFSLSQSHGCIHIRPRDRDQMMALGYLKAGVEVEIKAYGLVGPP